MASCLGACLPADLLALAAGGRGRGGLGGSTSGGGRGAACVCACGCTLLDDASFCHACGARRVPVPSRCVSRASVTTTRTPRGDSPSTRSVASTRDCDGGLPMLLSGVRSVSLNAFEEGEGEKSPSAGRAPRRELTRATSEPLPGPAAGPPRPQLARATTAEQLLEVTGLAGQAALGATARAGRAALSGTAALAERARPHLHALAESTKEAAVSGAKQADKAFSSYLQHVRYNLESYIEEGDEDELSEDDSSPRTRRSSRRSTRRRTLGAATPLQELAPAPPASSRVAPPAPPLAALAVPPPSPRLGAPELTPRPGGALVVCVRPGGAWHPAGAIAAPAGHPRGALPLGRPGPALAAQGGPGAAACRFGAPLPYAPRVA